MRLLLQSDMCGRTLAEIIGFTLRVDLREVDLKTGLANEPIEAMDRAAAATARRQLDAAGLEVFCLSTSLFGGVLSDPAVESAAAALQALDGVIDAFQPRAVRVLAPVRGAGGTGPVDELAGANALGDALAAAAVRLGGRGIELLVENGPDHSVISSPANAVQLSSLTGDSIGLVWDVQNMWQSGTAPAVGHVDGFGPRLRYVHVKGGRREVDGAMAATSLRHAGWPVRDVLDAVVASKAVQRIAINPPHGRYDTTPEEIRDDDVEYLTEYLRADGAETWRESH